MARAIVIFGLCFWAVFSGRFRWFGFAFIFAAITACGPGGEPRLQLDPHGAVAIDPDFLPAERDTIERGIANWRDQYPCVQLYEHPSGMPILRGTLSTDVNAHTTYWPWLAITIQPGRVGTWGERTVMHEIGHALGASHSKDPLSLMFHENNGRPTLTEGDKANFLRILGC